MKQLKYPLPIENCIEALRQIPGVGRKTAERYAFNMIDWKTNDLADFAASITRMAEQMSKCPICGCLQDETGCTICNDPKREKEKLCIVASAKDVFLIEETGVFKGLYHVIDHLFSPLDNQMLSKEELAPLFNRVKELGTREVILAFDATLEGDATSLYLQDLLKDHAISTSKLALGIPMGSSLDFIDEHTLSKAFEGRISI